MTPIKAMQYAREDIAELYTYPTHASCEKMHAAICGYSHALLDCGLISAAQQKVLVAEADAVLGTWQFQPSRNSQYPSSRAKNSRRISCELKKSLPIAFGAIC